MKKIIFGTLFFYAISLVQTSFFSHVIRFPVNFALLSVIIINLLEDRRENFGIYAAVLAGFFLDFFSARFFGYYILVSLALAFFIKLALKTNLRMDFDFKYGKIS